MNPLIDLALKYRPSEDWILKESDLPWLRLDISVPIDDIINEAKAVEPLSVPHRVDDAPLEYKHQGWRSLTIYGAHSQTTTYTKEPYSWTDIADRCPRTKEFLQEYWDINSQTGRIRFMWLDPAGYIMPHTDRESKGFGECNIAITHPRDCYFRFTRYGNVPFVAGSAFLVDISNDHLVVNRSRETRLHLIVHAKLKKGIVQHSYEQNFYR